MHRDILNTLSNYLSVKVQKRSKCYNFPICFRCNLCELLIIDIICNNIYSVSKIIIRCGDYYKSYMITFKYGINTYTFIDEISRNGNTKSYKINRETIKLYNNGDIEYNEIIRDDILYDKIESIINNKLKMGFN